MSGFCPHFLKTWISQTFPSLNAWQQANLADGVFGIAKLRSGIISELVRDKQIKGSSQHKHRRKRFDRFLINKLFRPDWLFKYWIAWIIKVFFKDREMIPIAIDWTTLPGNRQCLMAAIPFFGRGIPLMFRIMAAWDDIKDSQNKIEERFISRLLNMVPDDKMPILIGDRGFGRADLIKFLLGNNVLFVLRVTADVIITVKTKKGKQRKINLRHYPVKPGVQTWFKKISYRSDEYVQGVNLAAVVDEDSDDPWFLVTNLTSAATTTTHYESRFRIEEWFKDLKHRLRIHDQQTKSMKRIRRLTFMACLAYGVLVLTGIKAKKFKHWYDWLITGREKSASIVWLAIQVIKKNLVPGWFWTDVWATAKVGACLARDGP